MCGIAGIINKQPIKVTASLIQGITDLIEHRGPDGNGYYYYENIAFGHRRLAILDLTDDGFQPMHYDSEQYTITYNGEIYNYLELRAELKAIGHKFKSRCDTEVILAAYKEWGEKCVKRFNGMWSFSIHDKKQKVLFCSRDRFGVKPFYYINNNDFFAFGSEIKQLLHLLPEAKANDNMILDFLVTSITDHTNETFFKNVYKLPASHNLIYDLALNNFTIKSYYSIKKDHRLESYTQNEAEESYYSAFSDGIALRLRSDVKVGTCLSGGLDSSSVATIAAMLHRDKSKDPFCAITAVSTQANNDESNFAKIVAEYNNLKWLTTQPSYNDFVKTLEDVVYTQEEPFGSPSITMQYFVFKTARENGVTVLLDGQGGDETLLGYEKYYAAHFATHYREKGLFPTLRAIRDAGKNNTKMGLKNVLMYLVGGLSYRARYKFYSWRHRYLKELPRMPQHLLDFSCACMDEFELQVLENTRTNLPVLLRYEDKNSMAHSVETRLPFLDYNTLETALSLPGKYKIHEGWTKWVLRKIMSERMPDSIVWRKNKFGFEAPEQQWLRQHRSVMKSTVIASPILRRLCNMSKLQDMYFTMDMRSQWRLYSVAMWEKVYGVVS